tara:strand:+ start:357 stop:2345 length:1989 start_codon:yes stop_codon:yes gene_type:complete
VKIGNISFKYLEHIDALRAISVILVILFHINPEYFYFGYLGVDIFFVISGYVISNSIYDQQIIKKKSITKFYIKRFKRIFPILFLVITTFLTMYVFLSPLSGNTNFYFNSAITSLLGVSNFYFINNEINYFLTESINPLLHTWSLGVEEQFYILYPLFIVYLFKFLKGNFEKIFLIIFSLILLSFFIYYYADGILGNFYFPLSRFWEIGFGCLAFFYLNISYNYKKILNLFFLIIIFFIFYKTGNEKNIQETNLFITILTFICITSLRGVEKKSINKYIKKSKLPYLGKLSYSLYLWHLPVLYFCEIYFTGIVSIIVFTFSTFLLSIISYHKYENPIRKSLKFENIIKNIPNLIPYLIILIISIFFLVKNFNLKNSFDVLKNLNYPETKLKKYLNRLDYKHSSHLKNLCIQNSNFLDCKINENKDHAIYLTGDSHAAHFLPTVDGLNNINNYYYNGFAYCEIILRYISKQNNTNIKHCDKIIDKKLENLNTDLSSFKKKTIIISLRLSAYLKPEWKINKSMEKKPLDKVSLIKENYLKFIDLFPENNIILITTVPESKVHTENCIFNEYLRKKIDQKIFQKCHFNETSDLERYLNIKEILQDISLKRKNVFIFDPYKILCPDQICHNYNSNKDFFMLVDKDHLSIEASKSLSKNLEIFLNTL